MFLELESVMLNSVDEAIEAIGGTSAAAKLLGTVPGTVSNWRTADRIPAEYFLIFSAEFGSRGLEFNPDIFGFKREPSA